MTTVQHDLSSVSTHVNTSQRSRAVIYARVSVDDVRKRNMTAEEVTDAASVSIRAQLADGRRLAKAKSLAVVAELVDDGVSGFKAGGNRQREAYMKLVGMIDRSELDVLIARHADRVGRNDVQNSAVRIASVKAGVSWHLTSGAELDLSRSSDMLNLQVQQAIAEYESAVKSERLRSVYQVMRVEGRLRATNKVFGWQWEARNPERSMLAEPVERDAIQQAYRDLLNLDEGYQKRPTGTEVSLYSIITRWNNDESIKVVGRRSPKTGRKAERWSYASVRSVLLRPSNARLVSDGANGWVTGTDDEGKPIQGKWDALVPEQVYLKARALLTDKSRRTAPGRKSAYLASGIVKCGVCGGPLRSSTIPGRRDEEGKRIAIYRCESKLGLTPDPGVRHVSARITDHELTTTDPSTGKLRISRGLDWAVRQAVVAAFAFGPASLFPDSSPDLTNAIYAELGRVEAAIHEIGLALEDGAKYASVAANMKRLEARRTQLLGELTNAAASEAQQSLLTDIRRGVKRPGRVDVGVFAEYRAELGRRFDTLPLEQRRKLIRALLDITVLPLAPKVYGPRRWRIVHKVVASLNDGELDG